MIEPAEQLVTLFGGGGFVGRYVCEMLLKTGARVRVASRNPRAAHFIQPLGQVGQFGFVRADITNAKSVAGALDAGAEALVQVSAIGADPEAEANYGRTKSEGEQAIREVFPNATIIRPS